jgi:hypothetical protein
VLRRWLRRRHFRRVREQIRASLEITTGGRQDELFTLGRKLAHAPLGLPSGWLPGLAPAELTAGAEWCLRQILWQIARQPLGAYSTLSLALTGRPASQAIPLPPSLRSAIRSLCVRPRPLASRLSWFGKQVMAFRSGLRRVAFYLLTPNEHLPKPDGAYAVLHYARSFNLPPNCPPPHWDWVTWSRVSGLIGPDVELWASWSDGPVATAPVLRLRRTRMSLPAFRSAKQHRAFRRSLLRLTATVVIRWIAGAWWAPLLFRDLVELAHCRAVEADLAASYFFPPQFMAHRPLWTWWAEAKGRRAVLVFYSHNFQVTFPRTRPEAVITDPIYSLTRWSETVYLTEECGRIMEDAGGGAVAMVDSGVRLELPRHPTVAIFDIDPYPRSERALVGMPQPYHTRAVVRAFLEEVTAAVVEAGAVPVWKPKGVLLPEHALNATDLRYDRHAHLQIARRYGVVLCPGGVPVHYLAQSADAAIVLPFTTPATVFRLLGRPAVYFDPTGQLGRHARMARGAPILTDRRALHDWLREILAQPAALCGAGA